MHGLYIPSVLKSNYSVTLTFDFEDQGHIVLPVTDFMGVHIKINLLPKAIYKIS